MRELACARLVRTEAKHLEVIMAISILGVDISKKTFDVALLRIGKFKHKKFRNSESGFKELSVWLNEAATRRDKAVTSK